MAETVRLNKVLRELNISIDRAVDFLESKGIDVEKSPNTKISEEVHAILSNEFQTDANKKVASQEVSEAKLKEKEILREQREREIEEKQKAEAKREEIIRASTVISRPKSVGKIDLEPKKKEDAPAPKVEEVKEVVQETPKKEVEVTAKTETVEKPKAAPAIEKKEGIKPTEPKREKLNSEGELVPDEKVETQYQKLSGPKISGNKIDLSQFNKPKKKKEDKKPESKPGDNAANKKKRRRISKVGGPQSGGDQNKSAGPNRGGNDRFKGGKQAPRRPIVKEEPSEEDVQKQVRETLEKLQGKSSKGKGAKYRREKRELHREQSEKSLEQEAADSKILKVTEFVTASEVATMMDVPVTQIISACMSLGMMVTMNQRLDAETLTIVAEEFGYQVEFVTADIEDSLEEVKDKEEDLKPRAPIVTVMGHVDHGKTSLLDYIRKENVIAGESGGITQHIGAYGVELDNGQKIAFLDTPGHEAFTAMRARGAQVTDLAIIVVAADDDIMPQTKEAIAHAQAAGVPIIFAINKIDKPDANPEKIKEGLAQMNLLVEDWGGKIQSHDISAKTGTGVKELLEKVLLEAELLELRANPDKPAHGTVVEAFLDKGRGYISTILVQAGTLRVGDYVLAGKNSGKVKAMQDERGNNVIEAGPSTPVSILGLDGAPQAGGGARWRRRTRRPPLWAHSRDPRRSRRRDPEWWQC
mgnify:FL=1